MSIYKLRKTLLCSTVVLSCTFIFGCASHTPQPTATSNTKEIEAELAEWRKLKPGVQRLVAIEGELKGLLATLETLTENEPTSQLATAESGHNVETQVLTPVNFDEKPLPAVKQYPVESETVAAAEIVASEPGVDETTQTAQNEQTENKADVRALQPALTSQSFSLQLASVTKEDAVSTTWQQLKKRHPDVLDRLDMHSEQVLVANRTYYRVKAGHFETYNEAKQSCKQLQSSGASCIVNRG